MTYRIDKDVFFMEFARASAKGGKCSRKQVGAVVVVGDSVVVQGYNGSPRGTRHCDHSLRLSPDAPLGSQMPVGTAAYSPDENMEPGDMENGHCALAVHAELNCILNAARQGISILGGTMYVTVMPCFRPCASAVVNVGIKRIVFEEPYRPDERAMALYRDAGVVVHQLLTDPIAPPILREVVPSSVLREPWSKIELSGTDPLPWVGEVGERRFP